MEATQLELRVIGVHGEDKVFLASQDPPSCCVLVHAAFMRAAGARA